MNEFENIKAQWTQRQKTYDPEMGYKEILKKSVQIRKKQRIGQIVLGATVIILLLFFFYVSAYNSNRAFWGLGIMMASLVIRMIIEYFSIRSFTKIPPFEKMKDYNQKLISYYKTRKLIHFLVTPLLFGSYIFGFILLLPVFEKNLSQGFYTYILWSSVFIFIGLAILIGVQIRKELLILKQLKKEITTVSIDS